MESLLISVINVVILLSLTTNDVECSKTSFSAAEQGETTKCKRATIEITVSPLIAKHTLRILDITWDVGDQWSEGDWIGLYNEHPHNADKPLFQSIVTQPSGWVRSDIQEGRRFSDVPNFNKICLGYWAAYWKHNQTSPVTWSCLGTNPTWMGDMKNVIRKIKLKDLFIPGTHDSAAFHLSYMPFLETRFNKYVFAQDETILEQLIHGARYLDLRVGHYKGVWWLNHGIVKVHPLEHVLEDIKLFLNNTEEIVILDFHAFPAGFMERGTHYKFVKYLQQELHSYIAPPWLSWSANLGQLWDHNKRLILAYNDRSIVAEHYDTLWLPVNQKWPNVRSLNELYSYFFKLFKMNENKGYRTNVAWSAMAELTPDFWAVVSDKYHGLRNMADSVNHNVTEWFRGDWGKVCNAVAVDFIRSTGIVNSAIRWNARKGGIYCDP